MWTFVLFSKEMFTVRYFTKQIVLVQIHSLNGSNLSYLKTFLFSSVPNQNSFGFFFKTQHGSHNKLTDNI